MTFEVAKLSITKKPNTTPEQLEVLPTTVRWHGTESFSTHPSDPTCPGVPLPPGRPFITGASDEDPGDPMIQIATLSFTGAIEPSWHSHYNKCREITQLMSVNGVQKPLKIQLSCVVHPKRALLSQVKKIIHAAAVAVLAVIQVFHMSFRWLFGTPG